MQTNKELGPETEIKLFKGLFYVRSLKINY